MNWAIGASVGVLPGTTSSGAGLGHTSALRGHHCRSKGHNHPSGGISWNGRARRSPAVRTIKTVLLGGRAKCLDGSRTRDRGYRRGRGAVGTQALRGVRLPQVGTFSALDQSLTNGEAVAYRWGQALPRICHGIVRRTCSCAGEAIDTRPRTCSRGPEKRGKVLFPAAR